MPLTIIFTALFIIAISMWCLTPSSFFGYVIGVGFGIMLMQAIVRMIGKKAKRSVVASAIFYKITKYRAAVYVIHRQPQNISVTVNGDGDDYQNLMDILKRQMRIPPDRASEAARYAMNIAQDKPFQEKVRVALQSLDIVNSQNNFVARD